MNILIKLILPSGSYKIRKKLFLLKSSIFLITPEIIISIMRSYINFEGFDYAYKIIGLQKAKFHLSFEK